MPIDRFPFSANGGGVCRPCLAVRIINPHTGLGFPTYGMIDTGADECAIPAVFAPLLGHDLLKGTSKRIQTGNGETVAYSHTTAVEIIDPRDNAVVYRIDDTPVDFMPNLHVVLLGVRNFLGRFVLTIDYPKRVFSIKLPC
jgi:hypothetical protein